MSDYKFQFSNKPDEMSADSKKLLIADIKKRIDAIDNHLLVEIDHELTLYLKQYIYDVISIEGFLWRVNRFKEQVEEYHKEKQVKTKELVELKYSLEEMI